MFIGHFAVGFALKRVAPRTSLGVLMAAPQTLDLLWPIFLLLGLEHVRIDPGNTAVTPLAFDSYPYSHSLVMAIVWGAIFAAAYFVGTKLLRAAGVIAFAVAEGTTGSGDGVVRLLVEANGGEARAVTLTIAGRPFALTQQGAQ